MSPPSSEETTGSGLLSPGIICLIFLVFGAVWISAMWMLQAIGTWSQWAFLILSAVLLFILIRAAFGPLRESEARYRTLVEQAGSIILTMDPEGKITFFNRYAEGLFGFTPGEILGQSVIGTIVPATETSGRDLDQMMQKLLSTPGRFLKNRNENVTAEGRRITVLWTNHAVLDQNGNIREVLSVGTDLPDEPPSPAEPANTDDDDDDSIFF